MAHHDDSPIMTAVRDGEVEKLAILFERHHLSLFNFFLRLTGNAAASEDLVQDVFVRILKYRATYQPPGSFTVWMYQIARNAHIDHLRRRRDRDLLPLDDQWTEAAAPGAGPAEALETSREQALIRKALDSLPATKREVLLLSRFRNLRYREIAELQGCSEGTVKTIVHRALKDLGRAYAALQQGVTP
ncbi:MAG: sigma-70 family RNA polymerase sigma factor [Candidatus Aminicenantes bacterium]|nr:sigma-70 family RNA polymerase sigma factor [Candidatus Aminicenantes bacterium]